jgi:hypothetical protein
MFNSKCPKGIMVCIYGLHMFVYDGHFANEHCYILDAIKYWTKENSFELTIIQCLIQNVCLEISEFYVFIKCYNSSFYLKTVSLEIDESFRETCSKLILI